MSITSSSARAAAGAVAAAAHTRVLSLAGRPLLLAVEDVHASSTAMRTAARIADARGATLHVVHAITSSAPLGLTSGLYEAARDDIHSTLCESLDVDGSWEVHVDVGSPAGVIARRAAELDAALIVMGLRRHGALHRALHDETTLHVMRVSSCPVLGVTRARDAARHAVVGVDFGAASVRAAYAALRLLAPDGTLDLLYVDPATSADETVDESEARVMYAAGVDAAFDRLVTDLGAPAGIVVRTARVAGSDGAHAVAAELLAFAEPSDADLIAVGSRRHDLVDRLLLGSVTQALARDGRRSLLVVPPAPAPHTHRLDL